MRTMRLSASATPTMPRPMPNASACSGSTTYISASPNQTRPSTAAARTTTDVSDAATAAPATGPLTARAAPGPSAHHREGALDVAGEPRAPRPVVRVGGELRLVDGRQPRRHAFLDLVERGAGRHFLPHRGHHVVHVGAEGAEPVAPDHGAVPHDDVREVELGQPVERAHPVLRIAVAHVGRPADDGVARDDDLLLRQVDEHVALGVRAPQVQEMDLAVAPVELHRLLE